MKSKLAMLAAGVGMIIGVMPLSAHHSFAGTYLEDAPPITIEGTLVQFLVRNPHSFVNVMAKDPKTGEMVRWSIEWGAAGQLAQQGVNGTSLKVGDHVVVTGSPGRTPEDHRMRMGTITRPSDGWKWPNRAGQTFN
jgi:Family of unknown function (DUF6152)